LLCLYFNKIGEKGRTCSAWKWGDRGERKEAGSQVGEMTKQCTYEYMNKEKKGNKKRKKKFQI
jgi:hypothetical protein